MTGHLDGQALLDEFRQAHIFVLPSLAGETLFCWAETQAVAVQEAQACGCIVVATGTGGIPEVLDIGSSAHLVRDRDPAQIAATIENIVNSPQRWHEWQRHGRAWVTSEFDVNRIGERLWDLYRQVVSAGTGDAVPRS